MIFLSLEQFGQHVKQTGKNLNLASSLIEQQGAPFSQIYTRAVRALELYFANQKGAQMLE